MSRCATSSAATWRSCTRSLPSRSGDCDRNPIWSVPSLHKPGWGSRELKALCAAVSKLGLLLGGASALLRFGKRTMELVGKLCRLVLAAFIRPLIAEGFPADHGENTEMPLAGRSAGLWPFVQ